MAEAKSKESWSHTSAILAMTANVNRDVKKKPTPFKADDFNPCLTGKGSYAAGKKTGVAITKGNIGLLKKVFVK